MVRQGTDLIIGITVDSICIYNKTWGHTWDKSHKCRGHHLFMLRFIKKEKILGVEGEKKNKKTECVPTHLVSIDF